ncbi:MAG: hypothetical protein R2724_27325 [Bryobacterales bacterium]
MTGSTLMSAPLPRTAVRPPAAGGACSDHAGLGDEFALHDDYDVSPDGETFVLVDTLELLKGAPTGSGRVVENWRAELSGGR